ncbi:tetratricopeptide repeat protein [Dyadobacter diqingensis]|uniref:tetratricopeptide repeat protein n=1 Tax=Dyadobacter diqingensis TaxID=2938121 RepID=UPI0020C1A191|nr:tetratricopeptide repeat protein [Dyadobacter diqingensis]
MIWFILLLVLGIIIYLYYNHLDNSTKDLERDFAIANEYHTQGKYIEAIVIWTQYIEKYPTYYQLWNNRGEAKYQLGDLKEALKDFQKSVELKPFGNIRAYRNLEKTQFEIGRGRSNF